MARFERFINTVLPIGDVLYAEYKPRETALSKLYNDSGTFVHLKTRIGTTISVKVSGEDVLDSFLDWLHSFGISIPDCSFSTTGTPAVVVSGPSDNFDGGSSRIVCQTVDCRS